MRSSGRPRLLLSVDDRWRNGWWFSRIRYLLALRRAGARCTVTSFPRGSEDADALRRRVGQRLVGVDGVVLGGGGDLDPAERGVRMEEFHRYHRVERRRDRFEIELLRQALAKRLPVLGICRGAQVLNVTTGGANRPLAQTATPELRVARDSKPKSTEWSLDHRSRRNHSVDVAADSRLMRELGRQRMQVTSWHRHAVHECGSGVTVAARAEDGVVEAIEVRQESDDTPQPWQIGVQWHPEWMRSDPVQRRLFAVFVRAAERTRGWQTSESEHLERAADDVSAVADAAQGGDAARRTARRTNEGAPVAVGDLTALQSGRALAQASSTDWKRE